MKTVTSTEFAENAEALLHCVEAGESLEIHREGRAVAVIAPCQKAPPKGAHRARWVNREPPIKLASPTAASDALRAERDGARY